MRLFAKPHTFFLSIIVILLAGIFTITFQYFSGDLLQAIFGPPQPPDRSEASTAAIIVKRGMLRVGVRQRRAPFWVY